MRSRVPAGALLLVAIVMAGSPSIRDGRAAVLAQPTTRCASCHYANLGTVPSPEYLADWHASVHARAGVSCDRCHDGDPWTYEPVAAHRGVLSPANPASPVHPKNLVRTCSPCHQAITQAFGRSVHQTQVAAGERRAPTCVTCHGAMRARVLSPAALERQCAECHQPDSALADYPALMRARLEELNIQRLRAANLADVIDGMPNDRRRLDLLVKLDAARTALKLAIASAHGFEPLPLHDRVAAARQQLDAIHSALGR